MKDSFSYSMRPCITQSKSFYLRLTVTMMFFQQTKTLLIASNSFTTYFWAILMSENYRMIPHPDTLCLWSSTLIPQETPYMFLGLLEIFKCASLCRWKRSGIEPVFDIHYQETTNNNGRLNIPGSRAEGGPNYNWEEHIPSEWNLLLVHRNYFALSGYMLVMSNITLNMAVDIQVTVLASHLLPMPHPI